MGGARGVYEVSCELTEVGRQNILQYHCLESVVAEETYVYS